LEPAFLKREAGALARLAALLFSGPCAQCRGHVESPELGGLCRACWKGIAFFRGGKPRPGRRAAAAFEGAFREAIHAYKFGGRSSFARPFAELLQGLAPPADLLACVPTAEASLKERGFDSTAELARALGDRLGIRLYRGLKRRRQGEKQARLGRAARWLNVKGCFEAADQQGLKGARVLLLDDVMTTGATMKECSAALLRGGAANVECIALASGELRGN
jgi:ComF family protein